MGRYYSGDIEGKFWFGVQSSDDASFFGGEMYEPSEINYIFEEKDLDDVENGIAICEKELGTNRKKLDKFFSNNHMYNEEGIHDQTGIELDKIPSLLEWYARLELGIKIRDCVKENKECQFTAEL